MDDAEEEEEDVEGEADDQLRRGNGWRADEEGSEGAELDGDELGGVLLYCVCAMPHGIRVSLSGGDGGGNVCVGVAVFLWSQFICA